MALPDSDIVGLPDAALILAGMYIPVQHPSDGVTRRLLLDNLVPTQNVNEFAWDSGTEYEEDDVVTYAGKWWQSLHDANEGNVPQEDTHWTELSKNTTGYWQAGLYADAGINVFYERNGVVSFYELNTAPPFISSNFETELAAGQWRIIGDGRIKITASASELRNCGGTPKSLLPAIPNCYQVVAKCSISFKHDGVAFDHDDDLVIKNASGENIFFIGRDYINSGTSFNMRLNHIGQVMATNEALVLTTLSGNNATVGTGTMIIVIRFEIENANV